MITNHIKSVKHSQGKEKVKVKEARERDIAQALKKHNTATHLEGETLSKDQQVYRIRVVTAFLRTRINKVSHFRDVLEENDAFRLTDRSHMANLIPFIWKEEQQWIKNEIEGRELSVVFDGTTRLGEAVVILVQYVTEDMEIEQRLLWVQMIAKSMTGKELAREFNKCAVCQLQCLP